MAVVYLVSVTGFSFWIADAVAPELLWLAAASSLAYFVALTLATEWLVFVSAPAGLALLLFIRADRPIQLALLGLVAFLVLLAAMAQQEPGLLGLPIGVVFVLLVANGPLAALAMSVSILRRLPSPGIARLLPAFLAFGGSWTIGITEALNRYAELPTQAPDCYVATAATNGHPALVRSGVSPQGFPVNAQLQTLKAGEIALAATVPTTHQRLRGVYDHIGPRGAAQLRRHRILADIAFLALVPVQLTVRVLLRMFLVDARSQIDRMYR